MGAPPRALMGLCRGPTLDTQLLKAAVAAEQGLPLHNSVGLTALHCLCENEAVTAAALEAVLPCGPRDLALARDRCATSPLDLLCRNGAVSVAMLEVMLAWCGPELVEDRCGSALHVLCAARCATAAALKEFRNFEERYKSVRTRAPKGAFVAGATPLRTLCENEAVSLDALEVLLNINARAPRGPARRTRRRSRGSGARPRARAARSRSPPCRRRTRSGRSSDPGRR